MARPPAGLIPALALVGAWAAGTAACAGEPLPDRYGPAAASTAGQAPAAYAPSSRETTRAAPMRTLSWPGKSLPTAVQPAPAPILQSAPVTQARAAPSPYPVRTLAAPAYAPAQAQAQATPTPVYPAPAPAMTAPAVSPTFAPAASAPVRAAPNVPYFGAPTPGTPPPASTALAGPLASAAPAAPGQHARLYSVHRAYGMQPDPAPIPPAFFAQTADLSEPATPEPIPNRAANAATRNAVNAARLAAAEAN